jgi:hypothetical protein
VLQVWILWIAQTLCAEIDPSPSSTSSASIQREAIEATSPHIDS